MSAKGTSSIPITHAELRGFFKDASNFIQNVSYAPKKDLAAARADRNPERKTEGFSLSAFTEGIPEARSISVIALARTISNDDVLLTERVSTALNIVRTGIQIGMHVGALYAKSSGLERLKEQRGQETSDADAAARGAMASTQAAITVFCASSYITWKLSQFKQDEELDGVPVDFIGLPEPLALSGSVRALTCVVYHWASYLKSVHTDLGFIKITQLFFKAVVDDLVVQAQTLKHAEVFTENTYHLEKTDFVVRGFEAQPSSSAVVEFKRVYEKDIVGNHEMKRMLHRLSQMILAYDFQRKMNPMLEFGAFPWLGVLQGSAGTGKSMGLSYLQTLVHDHCKALGLPFQLRPIPNAIVQSLQGASANVYEEWWRSTFNPNFICVAPVDDSEAVYLDRRSQSSSEGSKLVVMSHLRLSEGSTAENTGSVLQVHATNNADMIDPPVFSRYQFRIRVPGAETRNDYCDQLKITGDGLNKKTGSSLINLEFPPDYVFLSDQGLMSKEERERKVEAFTGFKDKGLQQIWEEVEHKKLSPNSYDLYGTFFAKLHKQFEQFTSRDVRNVTTNMTSRLFGFDFPSEWLSNRDEFVAQDYDTKKAMILEAALTYQKGLTVEQVLFQEMTNYVESTIAMLDSGRKYRIRKMADDTLERLEAQQLAQRELSAKESGMHDSAKEIVHA
ncbi:AAA family ATPase [Candidatus Kaiserbacteria bacterium]|nr:AAA family ATPase [Candidatus Kaiserbacteria bacterium]